MNPKTALVTGSCGLSGSEISVYLARQGFRIAGIDDSEQRDNGWALGRLQTLIPGYRHFSTDIRDRAALVKVVAEIKPDVVVHCAAQPSQDATAEVSFDDFERSAGGTLNLLESARRTRPESPFIYMSTSRVYGDLPNTVWLREFRNRWDYDDPSFAKGIPETFSIDQSKHSVSGASRVAADIMVQEYGRTFGMPTCCLRGGGLTGPNHMGVELHGFLSYLVRCNIEQREYRVFGHKGKQVRDHIHAEDVAAFIAEFCRAPRRGEVYNLGGGRENSCSILEAFAMVEALTGKPQQYSCLDENRVGDRICYYSDLTKAKAHYPAWRITRSLNDILREIVRAWEDRLTQHAPERQFAASLEALARQTSPSPSKMPRAGVMA